MAVIALATAHPSTAARDGKLSPHSDLREVQAAPAEVPVDTRCRAAVEIIRDLVLPTTHPDDKRPFVFSPEPRQVSVARIGGDEQLFGGFDTNSPSSELLRSFSAHPTDNVVSLCPRVRELLTARRVGFDRASVLKGSALKGRVNTRAIIVSISLPAISGDGRNALYLHTVYCGGRCTTGQLVHASRDDAGTWRGRWQYMLWMS